MRAFAQLFLLLAAGGALSGCVAESSASDGTDASGTEDLPPSAGPGEFDEETGAVSGTVTDTELNPIGGAEVALQENGLGATSAQDGTFVISKIPPGTYNLVAQKLGYESKSLKVEVRAGEETSAINLQLAILEVVEPYSEKYNFRGYITCSIGMAGLLSEECGQGLQTSAGNYGANPNNKIDWIYNLQRFHDFEDSYVELNWQPGSAAAQKIALNVAHNFTCTPSCGAQKTYCDAFSNYGPPIQHCDIVKDKIGVSATNKPIEGQPWKVTARAWAAPVPLGQMPNIVLEQSFEMWRTDFYGVPKPDGYSAFTDK